MNGGSAQRKTKPHAQAAGDEAEHRLSPDEAAWRRSVLDDIARRVEQDGPHVARAHPDRARQFMPFAALKE